MRATARYARISRARRTRWWMTVQTLRKAAEDARGALVVEEYAPALAGRIDLWGAPAALDLMRRVKAQFDPHNTLNPGRFVGGI